MFENIKLALQGIWSHKMRSLLTMLGIIIGIASIISIVSTIKGTNEQIKEQLIGAGNNVVTVQLYQGSDSTYEMQYTPIPDGVPVITEKDREALSSLEGAVDASLYTERTYVDGLIYRQNVGFTGNLRGIDRHYFGVNGYHVYLGRDFSQADYDGYKKVAILDQTAAESVFPGENPLGQIIEIDQEPYTVIGVVSLSSDYEPDVSNYSEYVTYLGYDQSGSIYIPDALWPLVCQYDEPQKVAIQAASTDEMTVVGEGAANLINANLTVPEDSELSYRSNDVMERAQQMQQLANATNQQLIWIASISLLVGGIGVMNIMLVTVTERTREIGLKKAIGARKSRILWQFLTEAAVLTSMGGVIGVLAGIGMAQVVSRVAGSPTAISVPATLVAVVFSMLIGIIFGLMPAIKAANLNPIEALRRE